MRSRRAGTNIRRDPDMGRIALGLSRPGMDPRTWVEYGTVASVGGEEAPDFGDGNAVLVTQDGVDVDVVVGMDESPVTCRWGLTFGRFVFVPPISVGDHVMCLFPGGDLGTVGEIVKILSGPHSRIPVGPDRMPLFQNDRALLYADGVPIDVRTSGGARVLVDGAQVVLNEGTRGVARVEDSTKLTLSSLDLVALAAKLVGAGLVLPGGGGPPPTPITFEEGEITGASGTVKAGG